MDRNDILCIHNTVLLIMERCKVVVEPAGAAGVAALMSRNVRVKPGCTVVCIISGGNIGGEDLKRLPCCIRTFRSTVSIYGFDDDKSIFS